jgi:hypothetical protein
MDEQYRTSDTQGIAHEIAKEVTKVVRSPSSTRFRWWNAPFLAAVLTSLIAIIAIVGGLGRAFFVEKDVYELAKQNNALEHERMRQTLDRIDRSLNSQTVVLDELRHVVQAQAVELARMEKRRR